MFLQFVIMVIIALPQILWWIGLAKVTCEHTLLPHEIWILAAFPVVMPVRTMPRKIETLSLRNDQALIRLVACNLP